MVAQQKPQKKEAWSNEVAVLARQVRRVGGVYADRALFMVPSSRDPQTVYLVDLETGPQGWCSCRAYHYSRNEHCKHLAAVREFLRAEQTRAHMLEVARRYGLW